MEEIKNTALNKEAAEAVTGGAQYYPNQDHDPHGPHWQDTRHKMGTDFWEDGHHYYRIKTGDALSIIAVRFNVPMATIQYWNRDTITNVQNIYAGDTIVVAW